MFTGISQDAMWLLAQNRFENSKAFYCSRWKDGCALKIWKDCVARAGGPELNEKLIRLLLKTPELRGSTGVLRLSGGSVSFEPRRA